MDPSCGSWIAHPPEHVGRGTPAISGGAVFFSFFHFDILQNSKALVSKKCLFLDGHGFKSQVVHIFWSWVQTPHETKVEIFFNLSI